MLRQIVMQDTLSLPFMMRCCVTLLYQYLTALVEFSILI